VGNPISLPGSTASHKYWDVVMISVKKHMVLAKGFTVSYRAMTVDRGDVADSGIPEVMASLMRAKPTEAKLTDWEDVFANCRLVRCDMFLRGGELLLSHDS
jgi:hypothetical protein